MLSYFFLSVRVLVVMAWPGLATDGGGMECKSGNLLLPEVSWQSILSIR